MNFHTYMYFSHWRVEGLIREEEKGATEDDACIVPCLQCCNQDSFATNCVRVFFNLQEKNLFLLHSTTLLDCDLI